MNKLGVFLTSLSLGLCVVNFANAGNDELYESLNIKNPSIKQALEHKYKLPSADVIEKKLSELSAVPGFANRTYIHISLGGEKMKGKSIIQNLITAESLYLDHIRESSDPDQVNLRVGLNEKFLEQNRERIVLLILKDATKV